MDINEDNILLNKINDVLRWTTVEDNFGNTSDNNNIIQDIHNTSE